MVAACVTSDATTCGDIVCPIGRACARPGHCVDNAVVQNCNGLAEGATCSVPEVGQGTCRDGLCLIGQCGDGVINAIDACDGADLGGMTCTDFNSTDPAGLACTAECELDTSGCTAICGDGHRDPDEDCDGDDLGGAGCVDFNYYQGTLVCNVDCTFNAGDCSGSCLDGVKNGLEPCDGTDFGGATCASLGYLGQTAPLSCTTQCSIFPGSCACGLTTCAPTTQQCVVNRGVPTCQAI